MPFVFLLMDPHAYLETSDVVQSCHTSCTHGGGVDIMIEAMADRAPKRWEMVKYHT
jgi:O-acetyl-ADP-ribose deacetylase (regulator of RNase III)